MVAPELTEHPELTEIRVEMVAPVKTVLTEKRLLPEGQAVQAVAVIMVETELLGASIPVLHPAARVCLRVVVVLEETRPMVRNVLPVVFLETPVAAPLGPVRPDNPVEMVLTERMAVLVRMEI